MTLLDSVNKLRSSASPQLKSGSSSSGASDHRSVAKGDLRQSERISSADRDERCQTSAVKGSSAIRRANTDATKPSKNPFSRLMASGDMPTSNNPFSRKEPSEGLHRSNAVASTSHSKRSGAHHSHYDASSRPSSLADGSDYPRHSSSNSTVKSRPVGLTRSYSTSPYESSHRGPYESSPRELNSRSGALISMERSRTVSSRPIYSSYDNDERHGGELYRPSSYDLTPFPSRAKQAASKVPSVLSPGPGHVTMNITNINVNSNNSDAGYSSRDPMGGFSEIDLETQVGGLNISRGGSGSGRSSRFQELFDDDDDDGLESRRRAYLESRRNRVQKEIHEARDNLAEACSRYNSRR